MFSNFPAIQKDDVKNLFVNYLPRALKTNHNDRLGHYIRPVYSRYIIVVQQNFYFLHCVESEHYKL